MLSYSIIQDLYLTNRVFCSTDYDDCIAYLGNILPFKKHRYTNTEEAHLGWMIHPKWDVEEAYIKHDGEVILDATEHPLAVIALSTPFQGEVTLDELTEHLHTVSDTYDNEEALPIHYRQQYRPWERDWGFCVTKPFYRSLESGTYQVVIRTREAEGYLDVLEYTHQGAREETFVLVTHLTHQGMANANLAGCAVAVALFDRLRARETKFSYRLMISQPTIASEYYLHSLGKEGRDPILGALFVGGQGTDTPLSLQHSARGDSIIDRTLRDILETSDVAYRTGAFRTIVGYDEAVWEAYHIPMPSLTRYPYPQYHTSDDDLTIISQARLQESLEVLHRLVLALDRQHVIKKKFEGVPCVSNPRFDLFVDAYYDVYLAPEGGSDQEKLALRGVMDHLPMIDRYCALGALQDCFAISEERLLKYLEQWEAKQLIEVL